VIVPSSLTRSSKSSKGFVSLGRSENLTVTRSPTFRTSEVIPGDAVVVVTLVFPSEPQPVVNQPSRSKAANTIPVLKIFDMNFILVIPDAIIRQAITVFV